MTVPIAKGVPMTPSMAESELELLLNVIRETAQITTSATACALVMDADIPVSVEPELMLTSSGQLGAALRDFCRKLDTEPDAEETRRSPDKVAHYMTRREIEGQDYVFLCFPLSAQDAYASGTIGFAYRAEDWRPERNFDACMWLSRCAETMLVTFENMAGLEFDLLTLSNRAARLQRIAEIDPLTQLENLASFEEKARTMLEQGPANATFVIVDIDHFKAVNDLYGHQFGDIYLKTVAKALKSSFAEGSVVGRLGGDEFGIVAELPPAGRSYLDGLLSRCRSNVQRATALLGKPDLGKVSMGASQFPDHGTDYTTLYELADAALYAAKDQGRSVSTVFQPARHGRYNNAELGKKFLDAVKQDRILPVFQPIVSLKDGTCQGFEVLARWREESGALLTPADFSAIFRDHSLAETMTRVIMRRAFADFARDVKPRGGRHRLSLNVTYFDLMNPEFAFEVQSAATDSGLDWNQLTIEVTEQTMLGETTGQVFRSLKELRTRGARIALDDFGTGYGGLRHLANWPVDSLKLDKFFVDGLMAGPRDRVVLEAMVSMSKKLGYQIVAEGIETRRQVDMLREMGCQSGQGYVLANPLTGDQLSRFRDRYELPEPA